MKKIILGFLFFLTAPAFAARINGGGGSGGSSGGGGITQAYIQVQDEGSNLVKRSTINFVGSAVACVDNAGTLVTDCTVSASTSSSSSNDTSVRVYNSSQQVVTTGARAILPFDSERWDTSTLHDPVTNNSRLTASVTGKYNIFGHVQVSTFAAGSPSLDVGIILNGSTVIAHTQNLAYVSGTASSNSAMSIDTTYLLSVNDYVELFLKNGSAASLIVSTVPNNSPEFGMTLFGGVSSTATSGGGMSPGATYYVQVTNSLQNGATFYVSSGTVKNQLTIEAVPTGTFAAYSYFQIIPANSTLGGHVNPLLLNTAPSNQSFILRSQDSGGNQWTDIQANNDPLNGDGVNGQKANFRIVYEDTSSPFWISRPLGNIVSGVNHQFNAEMDDSSGSPGNLGDIWTSNGIGVSPSWLPSSGGGGVSVYPATDTIIVPAIRIGTTTTQYTLTYSTTNRRAEISTHTFVNGVLSSSGNSSGYSTIDRGLIVNNGSYFASGSSAAFIVNGNGKSLFVADPIGNLVTSSANVVVNGYISNSTSTPVLSGCGTGTPTISGNDAVGWITAGAIATTCTITFSSPHNHASCDILSNTAIASLTGAVNALNNPTSFTFGGTAIGGDVVMYQCQFWQ